jgi:hypothetical protein
MWQQSRYLNRLMGAPQSHDNPLCKLTTRGGLDDGETIKLEFIDQSRNDVDELITRANATMLGLGSGVWTRDVSKAHRLAKAIRAGSV